MSLILKNFIFPCFCGILFSLVDIFLLKCPFLSMTLLLMLQVLFFYNICKLLFYSLCKLFSLKLKSKFTITKKTLFYFLCSFSCIFSSMIVGDMVITRVSAKFSEMCHSVSQYKKLNGYYPSSLKNIAESEKVVVINNINNEPRESITFLNYEMSYSLYRYNHDNATKVVFYYWSFGHLERKFCDADSGSVYTQSE